MMGDYWERIKRIDPKDLVFLDEMGVLLGLTRTHARSLQGTRVYDLQPFYRGAKVTEIEAISLKQVLAFLTGLHLTGNLTLIRINKGYQA